MMPFDLIARAKILCASDFSSLSELQPAIEDAFKYQQVFRTRTEMEASILSDIKRATPDAKYWQSVREQMVMFSELVSLSYEYRKTKVEQAKAERAVSSWADKDGDDLDKELVQIEAERLKWVATNYERTAHDRIREILEWQEIKDELAPSMRCSTTDVNEHQLVSYAIGWLREVAAGGLETGSAPERINLIAKLDQALKLCVKNGCLDLVLEAIDTSGIDWIKRTGIGGDKCLQLTSQHLQQIQEKGSSPMTIK